MMPKNKRPSGTVHATHFLGAAPRTVWVALIAVSLSCGGATSKTQRRTGPGLQAVAKTSDERATESEGIEVLASEGGGAAPVPSPPPRASSPDIREPEPADPVAEGGSSADSGGADGRRKPEDEDDPVLASPPPARKTTGRAPRRARPAAPPRSPGVKAGAADDNVQFNAYLRFLSVNGHQGLDYPAHHRRVVRVVDADGRPWPGAEVDVLEGGERRAVRRTYADGRTVVFPAAKRAEGWSVRIRAGEHESVRPLGPKRAVEVVLAGSRPEVRPVPLDVAFILDTTGSMQDEIDQLRATLNTINFQIQHASPAPAVRYGLVLYRDVDDAYRTRITDFTDLETFAARLAEVSAGGGDDYPEDVQAGLEQAVKGLGWREFGVKIAFLIGDAPPHLDYGQSFTYLDAARVAAERGIKIATIGATGLDRLGELVWRQIAQQTMAPFVFLTHGEKGDAEGSPSSVSHHVGANWVAEDLDAIVIRMVKAELAHWRPRGAPRRDDYFVARSAAGRPSEQILEELFRRSAQQLVDYAVESIDAGTPTVVLPLKDADPGRGRSLERRLAIGLSRQGRFQLVEEARRTDMLRVVADQMALAYDESRMVEVGKLIPARLAVLGAVDEPGSGSLELLVKLVRLETGEVLSLSLLKIDDGLL